MRTLSVASYYWMRYLSKAAFTCGYFPVDRVFALATFSIETDETVFVFFDNLSVALLLTVAYVLLLLMGILLIGGLVR
ncbi:hypothetical protein L915_19225 [Phytophthora nicotianae]|uniref:Uncharacterized protein n=1 Tax=Phytophthora nicotianae TaxID=4792 RepID=W2I1G4_PHYNI|nr:hypothetical protein L915_19225 [Phytophthora nicotianae]ETL27317.1 hypothetical protein L916_19119 [Phytophthora nicotianae]